MPFSVLLYRDPLKRAVYFVFLCLLFTTCQPNSSTPEPEPAFSDDEIIRIPVVVHVLYSDEKYNISDAKIASQLAVLNQDFRKRNPDHVKTPAEFAHLVADAGIEFSLATVDPQGKPTSGITRTFTTVNGWDGKDLSGQVPAGELKLFHTSKGGHDSWPPDRYLNIWVAELSTRNGELALSGYAFYPGPASRIDGVVIDPRVFGTLEPLADGHRLGRTATHEIGHWLNLIHIFGSKANDCSSTDLVDDTPSTGMPYTGNPSYPQVACGHSNMFMNFMDWVNDEAMYMFTKGQRARMRAVFAPGGPREALYRHSKNR